MAPRLSIIVCTYNRPKLLESCLDSIVCNQGDFDKSDYELIVVDNYHDFSAATDIRKKYIDLNQILFIQEQKTGLSFARNKGIRVARGEWLFFLDDDAMLPSNFIARALKVMASEGFDGFGGGIRSIWPFGKPPWLSMDFGSKPISKKNTEILQEGYLWGSNFFVKKEPLNQVGGFPRHVGMKGTKIGYSAENHVQDRLREEGYVLGLIPDLEILHAVGKQKLNLGWHLKAAFATGRDGVEIFPEQYTLYNIVKLLLRVLKNGLVGLKRCLLQPDYYVQNLMIDTVGLFCRIVGMLYGKLQNHKAIFSSKRLNNNPVI